MLKFEGSPVCYNLLPWRVDLYYYYLFKAKAFRLLLTILHSISFRETAQTGCSVEKEWRENLQKQGIANREEIARLRAQVTHVTEMKSALKMYQRENEDLKRSCNEQEKVGSFDLTA